MDIMIHPGTAEEIISQLELFVSSSEVADTVDMTEVDLALFSSAEQNAIADVLNDERFHDIDSCYKKMIMVYSNRDIEEGDEPRSYESFEHLVINVSSQINGLNLLRSGLTNLPDYQQIQLLKTIPAHINMLGLCVEFPNSAQCNTLLSSIPEQINTLQLEIENVEDLSVKLPQITTLRLNYLNLKHSEEKTLERYLQLMPNLEKIELCDHGDRENLSPAEIKEFDDQGVTSVSQKLAYLENLIIEKRNIKDAIGATLALSQLDKGIPNKDGKLTKTPYPDDLLTHVSEFFQKSEAIRKGLKALKNSDNNETGPTDSPKIK